MLELLKKIADYKPRDSYVKKTRLSQPNLANKIACYLQENWPALFEFGSRGVWVTGSTVWRIAYDLEPSPSADLDLICSNNAVLLGVTAALGGKLIGQTNPADNKKPGYKYGTPTGRVLDAWISDPNDAMAIYPELTHGHCRVAFCPATGELRMYLNKGAQDASQTPF